MIRIPHKFTPRPYQVEVFKALENGKKFAFLRWSRRAGKDKACFNYLVSRMVQEVGIYFYLFPTFAQGRKALWETIQGEGQEAMKLLDHIPKELIARVHNNEMRIELKNGSLLRVVGTDNFDNLMGTNPKGLVFSEYQGQNPKAWEYLQPIILQNGGWVIFNGTPRGKNHFYDLEMVALKNPTEWYVSTVQSLNPELDHYYPICNDNVEDTIKMITLARQSGTTEDLIAQEYGVSYTASAEGTYYADCIERARKDGRIGAFDHDPNLWVDTFWDLGKNDDTVVWFRQQRGDRLIFIDVLEDSGKTPAEYVELLKDKGYKYRTHYMPHDAGHDTMAGCVKKIFQQCFQSAGMSDDIVIADKPVSKITVIHQVRARFGRYFFNEERCGEALVKLTLYHRKYDQARRVFLETPVHDWCSHAADALSTEAITANINEVDMFIQSKGKIITDWNPLYDV